MIEAAAPPRRLGLGFWSFIVLMLALTGLFAGLGVWQLNRLAWKEGLIAEVTARLTQAPYELPSADRWPQTDFSSFAFHPVTASGHYLADKSVLVFTSLSEPKGKFSGPGYWVMTPLETDGGGTVFVNRGFVPQADGEGFLNPNSVPPGRLSITGVALEPESVGPFTPAPDTAHRIEWVRDPARLGKISDASGPILPLIIDAPATGPGTLPQGGETVIDFPNSHFGYALTWFGFAVLTPCLLAFWVVRQLRPSRA